MVKFARIRKSSITFDAFGLLEWDYSNPFALNPSLQSQAFTPWQTTLPPADKLQWRSHVWYCSTMLCSLKHGDVALVQLPHFIIRNVTGDKRTSGTGQSEGDGAGESIQFLTFPFRHKSRGSLWNHERSRRRRRRGRVGGGGKNYKKQKTKSICCPPTGQRVFRLKILLQISQSRSVLLRHNAGALEVKRRGGINTKK